MKKHAVGLWVRRLSFFRRLGFVSILLLSACGGSQANAPTRSRVETSESPQNSERSLSREILQYSSEDESLAWMDGGNLARSPFWRRLLDKVGQAGDPFEENKIAELKSSCLFDHLSSAGDVLVSVKETQKKPLIVVEYKGNTEELVACFRELQEDGATSTRWVKDPELGGREVIKDEDFLLVSDPPFLVMGQADKIHEVFSAASRPRDLNIPAAATFVAEVRLDHPDLRSARVVVRTEGEATVFEFDSRLTSKELAEKFSQMAEKGQRTALQALQNLSDDQADKIAEGMDMTAAQLARSGILEQAKQLVASFSLQQRGSTVHGNVRIPTDQTLDTFLALSIYGLKRYVHRAKEAEAHQLLFRIGRRMHEYFEEHKRLPPSAAPIPAQLPPGSRYQSSPTDWEKPGWAELGVSLNSPQYYSYEIVVAPDGRSFRAYARGDLDGDGIPSELSFGGVVERQSGSDQLVLETEFTIHEAEE